jgi:hypothetical protein
MLRYSLLLVVLSLSAGVQISAARAENEAATAAFQRLKALAGSWEGKDGDGNAVKTNFKLVVAGTTLMETLDASGMEEMITLYSVDGNGIALVHFCPTNNQPRMRALPQAGEVRELVFEFQGAGNLPSMETGHEHKLVMQFQDADHLIERWTWRHNGKDTEMVFRFARQSGS